MERKAKQLHGFATAEGLSLTHLRLGAAEVAKLNLPLRDGPVIREARRFAEMGGEEAKAMWSRVLAWLRKQLPDSTFAIWIAPLQLVGVKGKAIILTAPDGIRCWVERRYFAFIRDALQATDSGYTEVEFVSAGERRG